MSRRGVYPEEGLSAGPQAPLMPPDPSQLGMFAPEGWPQRPPAPPSEQRPLPLPGTLAARYAAWRGSENGERVFRFIQSEAWQDARAGAQRLSIDAYAVAARRALHVPVNNSYRADLVRELTEAEPALRGRFETRKRTAP